MLHHHENAMQGTTDGFLPDLRDPENCVDEPVVSQPLYLTPLINDNQLDKARTMSRVGFLGSIRDVPSYSGFLTVNPDLGSNIFFWFFPAM
ncbi:hypothetical protein HPB47_001550, partial [Ixodes persulcatus]